MIRMTILLPVKDTIKHIKAIGEVSKKFGTRSNLLNETDIKDSLSESLRVWEKSGPGKWKLRPNGRPDIGKIFVLPARDNTVIVLTPEDDMATQVFDEFIELVKNHFHALALFLDTGSEPWKNSPPDKQERDRTIWEHRNLGHTWEDVAEDAGCGVTTAKERYKDMISAVAADSG